MSGLHHSASPSPEKFGAHLFVPSGIYDELNLKSHLSEEDVDDLGVPFANQCFHHDADDFEMTSDVGV